VVVQHATGESGRLRPRQEGKAMRIAVYGVGGVGGYFEGRLAQAGIDVQFIDRSPHLLVLRKHGLRVHSVKGDFAVRVPATDDPADIGHCDYVLF
jgi:2-dehydropantoate 2-reductase